MAKLKGGTLLGSVARMGESCREDIRERAFRFTCQLFDYCEDLARNPGMARRVAYQKPHTVGASSLPRQTGFEPEP